METANSIGGVYKQLETRYFKAVNPATGETLPGAFACADEPAVNQAMETAAAAFPSYRGTSREEKAALLRTIAAELSAIGDSLIMRAHAETGLPVARLTGELGRTTGQLNLFANLVEEGSWVQAVIDTAQPDRKPQPRPDIRKMLVPLGPVVVFGASNFPLAFSVAGGDTASALAAGCPVLVKAHAAHPGVSALVAGAVNAAVKKCGLPPGVFSMLYDDGYVVGAALVQHPLTKAVAFTGSLKGGMALQRLAAQRAVPVPVFAEMGSINPVVILPGAMEKRAEAIAAELAGAITLGAGQFCTNPGLLLAIETPSLERFESALAAAIRQTPPATMLTASIHHHYMELSTAMRQETGVSPLAVATEAGGGLAQAQVLKVQAEDFLQTPALREEVFGPSSLLVVAKNKASLQAVVASLQGQLTATVIAEEEELPEEQDLLLQLSGIAGRLIFNGVPTGVEVCAAMQHGGPFPASSDSRFTSVGSAAIYRFVRPLAWQNWPDALLPGELRAANPFNILRTTDQNLSTR